jgi:hypothetical protein
MNKLFLQICDLSSISDIKSLASRFSKKNVPLHVLVIKSSIILSVDCLWILFYFKKLQLIISFLQYKYDFWYDNFYNLFSSIKSNMLQFFASRLTMLAWSSQIEWPHRRGESFMFTVEIIFFANPTYSGRLICCVVQIPLRYSAIAAIWQYFVLNCIS